MKIGKLEIYISGKRLYAAMLFAILLMGTFTYLTLEPFCKTAFLGYEKTTALVTKAETLYSFDDSKNEIIGFKYTVNGELYSGEQQSPFVLKNFRMGDSLEVFYNPQAPQDSGIYKFNIVAFAAELGCFVIIFSIIKADLTNAAKGRSSVCIEE